MSSIPLCPRIDRWEIANLEIAFLLRGLERYDGIVIFAINHQHNIEDARAAGRARNLADPAHSLSSLPPISRN